MPPQRWGEDAADKSSTDKALRMKAVMEQQRVHLTMNAIRQAARGDLQRLKELRQHGADFKMGDYDGRTALHLAAARGFYDVCQFILSEGTDVNRKGEPAVGAGGPLHMPCSSSMWWCGSPAGRSIHALAVDGFLRVLETLS